MNLAEIVKDRYEKSIKECTNQELYSALLEMTKGMAEKKEISSENQEESSNAGETSVSGLGNRWMMV